MALSLSTVQQINTAAYLEDLDREHWHFINNLVRGREDRESKNS
jgi:hypothetical protein